MKKMMLTVIILMYFIMTITLVVGSTGNNIVSMENDKLERHIWYNGNREEQVFAAQDEIAIYPKDPKKKLVQNFDAQSTLINDYEFITLKRLPNRIDITVLEKKIAEFHKKTGNKADIVFYRGPKKNQAPMALTGEIIVKFKPDWDETKIIYWTKEMELDLIKSFPFSPDTYLFEAGSGLRSLEIANQIYLSGQVVYAYPNWWKAMNTRAIPNDPLFSDQWHLNNTGQGGGTSGEDANITSVWDSYRGSENEVIAIVDDGLELLHEDLAQNILPGYSWDYVGNDDDPTAGDHGTSVAGVAAARGLNALGVTGAAPETRLIGYRLTGAGTNTNEATALSNNSQVVDIYSNSWGPWDDRRLEGPGPLTQAAFANGVTNGRGGKGNIYVWAGGNGNDVNELDADNSNYDGYANSRYVMAIAASDNFGRQSWYSENGSNILVNAPSNGRSLGITTIDRTGPSGYDPGNYTSTFGGTSSATPLVSGIISLMLQANPDISWRDIRHILAKTAEKNDPTDPDWTRNGAGYNISHKYGFGRIDAYAAVNAATSWNSIGPEVTEVAYRSPNLPIPDNNAIGVSDTITIAENISIEFVEINFTADDHAYWGDLEIELISPSGTRSILAKRHNVADSTQRYNNWIFGSVRHMGEFSEGTWRLNVRDLKNGDTGTFQSWALKIYGTKKESIIYTFDDDFDEGILTGLEHDTVHDQLQLSKTSTAFPFIWVPNTGQGTISKVDTVTGKELGRYRVTPPGLPGAGSPSRTTVDLMGNVWVGNRQAGTVVKVGLSEAGQCIDRNGNGNIETSLDTNNDGDITGTELLVWGSDECVLYEVVLIPGKLGTFTPGTYSAGYDTNSWGVAPRGLAIDAANNLWAGTYSTSKYYYIDGTNGQIVNTLDVSPWGHHAYGATIDKNGILWSAELSSHVLRINTSNLADIKKINVPNTYGIGIDFLDHVFVAGRSQLTKINVNDVPNPLIWTKSARTVRGVVATSDNNVWVAGYDQSGRYQGVSRYDNDGNLIATIPGFNSPSGVAVDSAGKVWVSDIGSEYIRRIDPSTNTVDLSKAIIGSGGHYTYSDMTGFVARGITTTIGTWNVISDSGSAGTSWGRVSWNGDVPAGGSITVRVRTADTEAGLQVASYQSVGNGVDFAATGRYIQMETTLKGNPAKESPVLYDLTVEPASDSSISGMVFDDQNGNGAKDVGESGLSGIDIQLARIISPGVESPVSSTVTDANGNYNFMGLTSGDYKVEANFFGFARSQTYPLGGTPHFIEFSGSAVGGYDFGAQPIAGGEIRGTKFNDSNSNGIQNPGEEGLSGVTICLWPSSRCTVTDNSGNYAFADVPPGTQTVYELVPAGYGNTTPTMVSVTVNSGEIKTENFGNRKLVPPLPDVIVPGAINEDGVPEVFVDNTLVIRKDLTDISDNIIGVKLTLEWADGTTKIANMAQLGVTNVWEATLSPSFPPGAARMTFEVDIDPAGPGSEDAIQIGDIVFLDPSGQIRSKCTNAPINGATATLLIESPPYSGIFVPSPPAFQIEPNPQVTGEDGKYAWMASAGRYKVRAEMEGYVSEESLVVEVPPVVTDLDLELTCLNQPPVAADDTVTTDEDTPVTFNVTTNDSDADGNLDPSSSTTLSNPSHGNIVNDGDGMFTYTPDAEYNSADSFTYEICDTDGLCDTATATINVNPVNDPPVASVDITEQTVQYSDGISTVIISASDIDSPLTLTTSWKMNDGAEQTGLPDDLTVSSGSCTTTGPSTACTWTLEGKANVTAGNYNITFKVSDGQYEVLKHTNLIVTSENSMIAFDGSNPVAVKVAAPGGKSEAFSLKVNVKEAIPDISDALPFSGNINLAEVSVSLVPVGPGSSVNPDSCSRTVAGTGYDATLMLDCGFNNVDVNTYEVMVTVTGGYYIGSGENVLVVYDPSLGFTTGGGTFLWPETGEKTNFGYTMKYNKKGKKVQGSLLLVRHLPDGTIYRVKSNALYGLSIGEDDTYGWASFSGKATYLEPEWLEPVGNHEFIVYVEDREEPGNGADHFWIKVNGQDGKPIDAMSLNYPSIDNKISLSGGNIVVPHK